MGNRQYGETMVVHSRWWFWVWYSVGCDWLGRFGRTDSPALCAEVVWCWADSLTSERPCLPLLFVLVGNWLFVLGEAYTVRLHTVRSMIWRHKSWCQCPWLSYPSCIRFCNANAVHLCGPFPAIALRTRDFKRFLGIRPSFIMTTCPIQRWYRCFGNLNMLRIPALSRTVFLGISSCQLMLGMHRSQHMCGKHSAFTPAGWQEPKTRCCTIGCSRRKLNRYGPL